MVKQLEVSCSFLSKHELLLGLSTVMAKEVKTDSRTGERWLHPFTSFSFGLVFFKITVDYYHIKGIHKEGAAI